ncbi:hypothetical protein ACFP81_06655 [Deinococcus lacus]|uniref:Uncharacterized protein n=1 Tax=Deinococcus lacus TaxID=392561 RepID=A0ABW1YCL7_9DEIO
MAALERTGWKVSPQTGWKAGRLKKGRLTLDWEDQFSFGISRVPDYTYRFPGADLSGASWAELDMHGRLVYARAGCVYRHTDAGERLLADLNSSAPPLRSAL